MNHEQFPEERVNDEQFTQAVIRAFHTVLVYPNFLSNGVCERIAAQIRLELGRLRRGGV